jgi:Family of unknown function (DUF6353)
MNTDQLGKQVAGATQYFLKKHGPALLTVTGVGAFIASNYLTARAALKSQDKVKELKLKSDEIKAKEVDASYSQQQKASELGRLWVRHGLIISKDFAPAIATGSVAIICVVSSHKMMQSKQAALLAAYTAVSEGFKAYRKRVQEEVGTERELELYRGPHFKETRDTDGDLLEKVIDYDDRMPSPYARFFDATCAPWTKTPEYNALFLKSQQNWFNDRLHNYGYVFLNEVYEALGIPRCQFGQIVGWKLNNGGDNFVDFGIHDIFDENSRAFINGHEGTVMLDFNVDGPISI